MIVTRFTPFTENVVICSYQVTKIFRSGHACTSTSSARSNCYFRLQADIAVWVSRKVSVNTVLTRARVHFLVPRQRTGDCLLIHIPSLRIL